MSCKINYGRLLKLYEQHGKDRGESLLKEMVKAKDISLQGADLGKLFSEAFGHSNYLACRNSGELATPIMEAAGAVTTAAFQSISGQIIFSAIWESYEDEDFVFSKMIPEVQTQLSGEKIPHISPIGDEALVVNEGDAYPLAGVKEDYIETPETKKRGMIVPLTREAVFFDRTGRLVERCKNVGYWLGYNREVRAVDCVIDEGDGAKSAALGGHRYHWRGNSIASYGNNSGNHTFDNLEASCALVDWTDLDQVEQLFNQLTDPNTGTPIVITAKHLVVTKSLEQVARRIVSATEIRVATPGFATSGNPTQTTMANPYANKYEVVTSRLLASRLATDTDWFLGDLTKYARYMQNWPLQVKEAPANSHDEFHRDIVSQYRADERGAYSVWEPRAVCKATA